MQNPSLVQKGQYRHVSVWLWLFVCIALFACSPTQAKPAPNKVPKSQLKADPFAGLPPMKATGKEKFFNFRPGPKPPGKIGTHIQKPFPPKQGAQKGFKEALRRPKVKKTPLRIVHTKFKRNIVVMFNQPMIALSSLKVIRRAALPIRISPKTPGTFRWLGTSTISFEPKLRLRYATRYTVTIPKGVRSASGMPFPRTRTYTFETPRLKVTRIYPSAYRPERPDTWIALQFNQVPSKKVLRKMLRFTSRGQVISYTFVPTKRWNTHKRLRHVFKSFTAKYTLVLRPKKRLTKNTRYHIYVPRGTRGEGALKTKKGKGFNFRTYPPMRLERVYCSYTRKFFFGLIQRCRPTSQIILKFSNPLRGHDWKKWITFKGKGVSGFKIKEGSSKKYSYPHVSASGRYMYLRAKQSWRAGQKMSIRIRGGIQDVYGQRTRRSRSSTFTFTDFRPIFRFPHGKHITLEQKGERKLYINMRNIRSFRKRVVRIKLSQLYTLSHRLRRIYARKYRNTDPLWGLQLDEDRTLYPKHPKNVQKSYSIDLAKHLGPQSGLVLVVLSSPDLLSLNRWQSHHRLAFVQSTDIGITMRYAHNKMALLANYLSKNQPTRQAVIELYTFDGRHQKLWSGKTDARGYAELPGPAVLGRRGPFMVVVRKGQQRAFMILKGRGSQGHAYGFTRWSKVPKKHAPLFYTFTERLPYKPGELIRLQGILRRQDRTPLGGIKGLPSGKWTLSYQLRSPRYQLIKKGTLKLKKGGMFTFKYRLKPQADQGRYSFRLHVRRNGKRYQYVYHVIQVQAFRSPEYKVSVRAPKGPHFIGTKKVKITVEGRYTFGAPMSKARTVWTLRRSAGSYRPPHQPSRFRFGIMGHLLYGHSYRGRYLGQYRYLRGYRRRRSPVIQRGQGTLNARGQWSVPIALKAPKANGKTPLRYVFEARVIDKNRQSIANRITLQAHRASVYVGLHKPDALWKAKKIYKIGAIAVSIAGKRLTGKNIHVRIFRRVTTRKAIRKYGAWTFRYGSKDKVVKRCTIVSGPKVRYCKIRVPHAGLYFIEATVSDAKKRSNTTRIRTYATGKNFVQWQNNRPGQLDLVADKKLYKAGEKASILIRSPFRKAYGIVTVERNGLATHYPITLTGSASTVSIPIRSEYLPNAWVSVSLARGRIPLSQLGVRDSSASDLGRPAYAFGQIQIKVALTKKQLRVQLKPSSRTVRPGSTLRLKIRTTDHTGRAAPSFVTLALVDEGVLSLLGYKTPNPMSLYSVRPSWSVLQDLRQHLLKRKKKLKRRTSRIRNTRASTLYGLTPGSARPLADAAKEKFVTRTMAPPAQPVASSRLKSKRGRLSQLKIRARYAGGSGFAAGHRGARSSVQPIRIRSNFKITAFYRAMVQTDAKGEAVLSIKMPDNLTTFRVMAVAVDSKHMDRFGNGEQQVTLRKPLLLRPALPRFANLGDRFEASVVINNETKQAGKVSVLVRGVNVRFTGKTQKEIDIPAGESREVRFPVRVTHTGVARFQFAAVLGKEVDAVERKIPVLQPATAEAFATYGTTHGSVSQPIQAPHNALPQWGGLKISVSSTALTGLEDAVRYLVDYPFECTEQTASRAMPIFALKKILPAFKIGKVSDHKKAQKLARGAILKLIKRQRYDGGWGHWSGSRASYMWISSYALYALLRAKEAGYAVPKRAIHNGLRFLHNRLRYSPFRWERKSPTIRATALWVASEKKRGSRKHLDSVYSKRKRLTLFAKAWLMVTLHRYNPKDPRIVGLLQELNDSAIILPGRVHFAEKTTEDLRMLMHSKDRSDAIILSAFLEVRPKHPLIPKIVRGLMRSRIRGRWSSTQSNAFAMIALARYFKMYEKTVPNFTVQTWLGRQYAGTTQMKGRSLRIVDQTIPMRTLLKKKKALLTLYKRGKGRLYYRLGMRYAPKNFKLKAAQQGFSLKRTYEPVQNAKDVIRHKDGHWEFKAGAYVRVRLRITVPSRRFYVAVVDPLPAGLEAVQLGFKTSARSALRGLQSRRVRSTRSWYSYSAFQHTEKRDSMVVLFANRLPAGVYTYTYVARATTIGSFIIPPLRAEEMYTPEVFGRTATMFSSVVKK